MKEAFINRNPVPGNGKLLEQELDYQKVIKIILSRWYWVAFTLLLSLAIAYVYLWYTPPTYSTSTNIKFDEKKSEFSDLVTIINSGDRGVSKIQNESYVIRSREVILNAIKNLDWQVSYYFKGKVRDTEMYPQKPFLINIATTDSLLLPKHLFYFKYLGGENFRITYTDSGGEVEKQYKYGDTITAGKFRFAIERTTSPNEESLYMFRFNRPEDFYGRIRNGLALTETSKFSNIATVTYTDGNPYFAADALNAVIHSYLDHDVNQKAQSSAQIIDFIEEQLAFLGQQVSASANQIEEYKQKLNFSDVGAYSTEKQLQVQEIETALFNSKIALINHEQLEKQINLTNNSNTLNLGLFGNVDGILTGLINQYNQLIIKKIDAASVYSQNSEPIREISNQLDLLRSTIKKNLLSQKEKISREIKATEGRLQSFHAQLNKVPTAEKNLQTLNRTFEVNEKIFSFLSEKKLEAGITKASILSSASLIEPAVARLTPVSPERSKIYRSAWILGILSGIGLIFMTRALNPYIYDKETVESITNVPIIGVIRKFSAKAEDENSQILSLKKPKSVFAESVRSVRTNLSFLASEKGSKVVCITSEISGEGKSFVTLNLASTLAMIDKKVILLAGDLRRSKLYKTFNVNNDRGLSTYLSKQDTDLKALIQHSEQNHLDYIVSGPVPPNPAELLYSERFIDMIDELKVLYDYILIDTAPVGLVSDAIPIIRQSDINLFIIRSGVSKYNAATIPQRIEQEYGLNNTVIVLNAFIEDPLHSRYYSTKYTGNYNGYYYYSDYSGYNGYGYYSDDQNSSWWKFWKKLGRKKAA